MRNRTGSPARKTTPAKSLRSASKLSPPVELSSPDVGTLLSKIGYLSAMELFSDMTHAEKEEVSRAITMRTCRPGSIRQNATRNIRSIGR